MAEESERRVLGEAELHDGPRPAALGAPEAELVSGAGGGRHGAPKGGATVSRTWGHGFWTVSWAFFRNRSSFPPSQAPFGRGDLDTGNQTPGRKSNKSLASVQVEAHDSSKRFHLPKTAGKEKQAKGLGLGQGEGSLVCCKRGLESGLWE